MNRAPRMNDSVTIAKQGNRCYLANLSTKSCHVVKITGKN